MCTTCTTCTTCSDKGIVRLNWADAPEDFALCLCAAGRWYRSDKNAGRHTDGCGWQVWCAREQIEPSRIFLLEEVLTAEELRAAGLAKPNVTQLEVSREAFLLAQGKTRRTHL